MKTSRPVMLWVLVPLALGVAGCPVDKPPTTVVSLHELLREHNANAAAVEQLWARVKVSVRLPGVPLPWSSATSLLILGKGPNKLGPHDFVLVGREAGVDMFRLGSNLEQGVYYFWYNMGGHGAAYVGRNDLAGAAGVQAMPIDPHQLLSLLGVCEMPEQLDRLPAVSVSMQTRKPYAYRVSYVDRQKVSNRILSRREVYFTWSDDPAEARRPFHARILDAKGRPVVAADLARYRPIETAGGGAPVMPTDIHMTCTHWPEPGDPKPKVTRSTIHLMLSEMTAVGKGNAARASQLKPPPSLPVIQVDRHLLPAGTATP